MVQLGATVAFGAPDDVVDRNVGGERNALQSCRDDGATGFGFREPDVDRQTDAAAPDDGTVNHPRAVRREDDENLRVALRGEAVELREELLYDADLLVSASAEDAFALVEKHHAFLVRVGFLEKARDVFLALADVFVLHFAHLAIDEGQFQFSGDGACEHGFASPGRSVKQQAFSVSDFQGLVDVGVADGIHERVQHGLLGTVKPLHVGQRDARVFLVRFCGVFTRPGGVRFPVGV